MINQSKQEINIERISNHSNELSNS